METIGIRYFKDHLSEYLKKVSNGEIIIITDRNEIIAQISQPLHKSEKDLLKTDAFIQEEINKGNIVPAKRKKSEIEKILSASHIIFKEKIDWKKIYLDSKD